MTSAPISVTGERLTPAHVGLIAMLAVVVMFEGFDISATSAVLPFLGKEFAAGPAALGGALSVVAFGTIAAWLLVRLGDRIGRRPLLLLAASGFSLGSLATVLVASLHFYVAVQFVTRMLLVTQIATAYLIVSETLPPRLRGRANGALGACGSFGAALPLLLLGTAVASPLGWRLLFVIGAAPLVMMPLLLWKLRETPVWLEARASGAARLSPLDELRALIAPALRHRFVLMSLLWFVLNFTSAVGGFFFTLYALQERAWTTAELALLAPVGLVGAIIGYAGTGLAMDLIGRRRTVMAGALLLGVAIQLCYSVHGWWFVAAGYLALQAMLGIWIAAYTLNSELFPTALRAAANGWCHNLLGRWGLVLAPWLVGRLVAPMGGYGPTLSLLGAVAYLAIPLVWIALPETRARPLDQP